MHIRSGAIKIVGSDLSKIQVHYGGNNAGRNKEVRMSLKTSGDVGELNIGGGPAMSSKLKLPFRKAAIFISA